MNKKTLVLIIILGIFLVLLIAFKALNNNILEIVNSSPKNNDVNIALEQTIKITFNKKISDEWQVSTSPLIAFKTKITNNVLEIVPNIPLTKNTQYKITVLNNKLKEFVFELSFKTINQDNILLEVTPPYTYEEAKKYYNDWNDEIHKNEPLYDFVPYKTEVYFVYYTAPLTLTVITKKDTPQIRKEINDWISSKGIDPATHQIIWKVKSTLTF